MEKIIAFDMDGTIADLYGYHEWLYLLQIGSAVPYRYADPIYDMNELNDAVRALRAHGWRIAVISWTAKNANSDFRCRIHAEKEKWLQRYEFPYDELYVIPYGAKKFDCLYGREAIAKILIDDDYAVRQDWSGDTINAKKNILPELKKILKTY